MGDARRRAGLPRHLPRRCRWRPGTVSRLPARAGLWRVQGGQRDWLATSPGADRRRHLTRPKGGKLLGLGQGFFVFGPWISGAHGGVPRGWVSRGRSPRGYATTGRRIGRLPDGGPGRRVPEDIGRWSAGCVLSKNVCGQDNGGCGIAAVLVRVVLRVLELPARPVTAIA